MVDTRSEDTDGHTLRPVLVETRSEDTDGLALWPVQLYGQNSENFTDGQTLRTLGTFTRTCVMAVLRNRYGRLSLRGGVKPQWDGIHTPTKIVFEKHLKSNGFLDFVRGS